MTVEYNVTQVEGRITRELDLEEVLSVTIALYAEKFPEFFIPFLLFGIFSGIIFEMTSYSPISYYFSRVLGQLWILDLNVIKILVNVCMWTIFTIVQGFCVKFAVETIKLSGRTKVIQVLGFTIRKLSTLSVAGIIIGLMVSAGLLAILIPGLILAMLLALAVPVIIIEEVGVFYSLQRSLTLVSKGLFKTFIILLTINIVILFFSLIGEAIGLAFETNRYLTQMLFASFVQPLLPTALTIHYYSMHAKENQQSNSESSIKP
jgi:hypothetical protein